MKRSIILPLFLVFFTLTFLFVVSATSCDDLCHIEKGYVYGACRETTEEEGFCAGKTEDVYGFSQCTDYERCCCGNDATNAPLEEEENTTNSATGEVVSSEVPDSSGFDPKSLFWPLIIVVGVLALGVFIKKKAFKDEDKKEEESKEEKVEETKEEKSDTEEIKD
ncbi:hypothetical protein EXS74_02600 [Candidatus Woesearchaeota archaeon]|nr:hypothetical protein [Candidatus Woesearchaeota archaeon]